MKKLFALGLLVLIYTTASGQSGYILHHIRSNADRAIYEKALNNAHLDEYRFMDRRTIMTFNDSVEVELLSGREMQALGLDVQLAVVHTSEPPESYVPPTFYINPDGMIIAMYKPVYKHK